MALTTVVSKSIEDNLSLLRKGIESSPKAFLDALYAGVNNMLTSPLSLIGVPAMSGQDDVDDLEDLTEEVKSIAKDGELIRDALLINRDQLKYEGILTSEYFYFSLGYAPQWSELDQLADRAEKAGAQVSESNHPLKDKIASRLAGTAEFIRYAKRLFEVTSLAEGYDGQGKPNVVVAIN